MGSGMGRGGSLDVLFRERLLETTGDLLATTSDYFRLLQTTSELLETIVLTGLTMLELHEKRRQLDG